MIRPMKDSGVEWIGAIPDSWNVGRVKQGFYRKKEEAHQDSPVILSLARAGVKVRDITNNEGQLAESYYNYNPVMPGDLLLNPMDLYSGANCSVSNVCGVISPAYINLGNRDGFDSRFYDYYFKTQYWAMAMFAHGKGVSFDNRWTMNATDILNYYIPIPSAEEQQRIADFLDTECAKIDAAIEKTKATIEEYKALKQSIITEAVTKGIRGDRPMKDSGIEWIGEIPEGWMCIKAKHLITITHGSDPSTEGNIPVYGSGANSFKTCGEFKEGPTVLVGRKGATLHIPHYIEGRYWNVDTAFDVKTNKNLLLKLYYYQAISFDYDYYKSQTTLPGMTQTNYKEMYLPIPSEGEQLEIVRFLDNYCKNINEIISKKEDIITELESYKKSLIYEYVTGKKEVKA